MEHGNRLLLAVFLILLYIHLFLPTLHTHSSSFLVMILLDDLLVLTSDYLLPHLEKTAFPKLFSGTVN